MLDSVAALPRGLLPWQQQPWQQLWYAKTQQRLPHAVLLIGSDGIGKRHFAKAFAAAVLCQQSDANGIRCNTCHSCCMVNAGLHPDCVVIEPEEAGKKIVVDQIRALIKTVNETTLKGGYRVVLIQPASAMNVNAANALLKTLEEPAPNTLLMLTSNQSLRLPATIMSRCQKIHFSHPDSALATAWLQSQQTDASVDVALLLRLAEGAPLKALALLEQKTLVLRQTIYQGLQALSTGKISPLQLAAKCQDVDPLAVVDLLLSWLLDMLRYQLTQDAARLVNVDYQQQIATVSQTFSEAQVLAYLQQLQQTRADLLSSMNINKQLIVEDLFIRWMNYVSR